MEACSILVLTRHGDPIRPRPDQQIPGGYAARTLALDGFTGELATEFEREGIRCILLKGPAMARWLYDDDELLRATSTSTY